MALHPFGDDGRPSRTLLANDIGNAIASQGTRKGHPYHETDGPATPCHGRGRACPCPGFSADSPQHRIRQQSLKAYPGRDKSGPYTTLAPMGKDFPWKDGRPKDVHVSFQTALYCYIGRPAIWLVGIDQHIHTCRQPGCKGSFKRRANILWPFHQLTISSKRLDHLIVAYSL